MIKMNNTTKLLELAGALLAVALIAVSYVWFDLGSKGALLLQNMQVVKDRELLEREYVTLQGLIADTENDRVALKQYVLSGDDGAVSFLSTIEEIALDSNIDLTTQRLEVKVTPPAGFNELEVAFLLKGEQRSMMRMLQLFELLPYQGRVVSLTTTRKKDATTGSQLMEGSIVLRLSITEN